LCPYWTRGTYLIVPFTILGVAQSHDDLFKVYYRGFTRAFLAGETETTEELLVKAGAAVDRAARGKQVVLVDGVGFPAVGSICGTDNASVSKACGYPVSDSTRKPMGVLIVGGSGVGSAVDAFNLNSTYFEKAGVPVMGAVYNKLSETGFYSLENCKTQVTAYFDQSERQQSLGRHPYGFVPLFPAIAGADGMNHVEEYLRIFESHVDLRAILDAATRIKNEDAVAPVTSNGDTRAAKRRKVAESRPIRPREQIEALAIGAGAAPSA